MQQLGNRELKQAIRAVYAWPGGYEIFGITDDGGVLCCGCMKKEYKQVAYARMHDLRDGWHVVAIDATCNVDSTTTCDHCGREIYTSEDSVLGTEGVSNA
jgi:hypothetical protein